MLFHVQSEDELFPLAGQQKLFELLGSRDKQLISYPGPHGMTDPSAIAAWQEFIRRRLQRPD